MALLARTTIVASLSALAVAALSACGGEDAKLLPGDTAREITANLDSVKQLTDEGDCVGAESAAAQVGEQIEALGGVDRKLKEALDKGAERLNEVVDECEEAEEPEAVAPAEIPIRREPKKKRPTRRPKRKKRRPKRSAKKKNGRRKKKRRRLPSRKTKADHPGRKKSRRDRKRRKKPPSGGVESASPVEGGQGEQ